MKRGTQAELLGLREHGETGRRVASGEPRGLTHGRVRIRYFDERVPQGSSASSGVRARQALADTRLSDAPSGHVLIRNGAGPAAQRIMLSGMRTRNGGHAPADSRWS